jgi:Undecaprenyl-phosphate galactose phosphotransferase WbaP
MCEGLLKAKDLSPAPDTTLGPTAFAIPYKALQLANSATPHHFKAKVADMSPHEPLVAQAALRTVAAGAFEASLGNDPSSGRWTRPRLKIARYAVLCVSDLTALLFACTFGYVLWARLILHQPASPYVELLPLIWLFPVCYAAVDLYPGFGLGTVETLRRLFHSTSVSFLLLAAGSFVFKTNPIYSRITFAVTWAIALASVPLCRSLTVWTASRFHWWPDQTVIFGTLPQIELTIRSIKDAGSLGYEIVGALCQDARLFGKKVRGVLILGGLDLVPALTEQGVTTILAWDGPSVASELAHVQQQTRHIVFIREERQLPVERVQVRNLGGVLGIEFTNALLRRSNQRLKRALDIILGSACSLVALPMIAICGVVIKIASPGPIFFRQQRDGLCGRRFTVWKLRTMYPDAEARLAELLRRDPDLCRQWERNVKLARDPRLIPIVGEFLRRFSLDELPQLWNVIVGDMSLVGPRPFPEYHLAMLSPDFKRFRSAVRPGLTGMWQVMVRSDGDVHEQERLDTYYIRNWSIWLDLYILARTASAVLLARGAY